MAFPPAEKYLDVPSKLICESNLLSGEVEAISGDPIIDVSHSVANQTNFPFRLIDT